MSLILFGAFLSLWLSSGQVCIIFISILDLEVALLLVILFCLKIRTDRFIALKTVIGAHAIQFNLRQRFVPNLMCRRKKKKQLTFLSVTDYTVSLFHCFASDMTEEHFTSIQFKQAVHSRCICKLSTF